MFLSSVESGHLLQIREQHWLNIEDVYYKLGNSTKQKCVLYTIERTLVVIDDRYPIIVICYESAYLNRSILTEVILQVV